MKTILNGGLAATANGILNILAASSEKELTEAGAALGKIAGNYVASTETPIDDTLAEGFGLPFVDGLRLGFAGALTAGGETVEPQAAVGRPRANHA